MKIVKAKMRKRFFKSTYDKEFDCYYIYLKKIKKAESKHSVRFESQDGRDVVLDFDKDDKLMGIEIV